MADCVEDEEEEDDGAANCVGVFFYVEDANHEVNANSVVVFLLLRYF